MPDRDDKTPIITQILHHLGSTRSSLYLFILLAICLAPAATLGFAPEHPLFSPGKLLLYMLSLSLTFCTWQKRNRLSGAVIFIHIGVIVVLGGAVLAKAGFIATVNVYVHDTVSKIFRWDIQQESNLGFTLSVDNINQEFYPVPVQIGILKNNSPHKLIEVNQGEKFITDGYTIQVEQVDPVKKYALLRIEKNGKNWSYNTAEENSFSKISNIAFQLVAYKNPATKRVWVDITITPSNGKPIPGTVEVNEPFFWNGYRFYHTNTKTDENGRAYIGIQIVHDPGIPLVYTGFLITLTGLLLLLIKRSQ